MPEHTPQSLPSSADLRQLRTRAKERLRLLHSNPATRDSKLADAQRDLAREYGFPSWPALVAAVEMPQLIQEFKSSVEAGDADRLERLLRTKLPARRLLDQPLFDFDTPALIVASQHPNAERLLPILVRYGADPNVRSTWWAGGFSALDSADERTSALLVELGAAYDVWSAAAQGRADILRMLLEKDPSLINAPGGDGGRPLHFACNSEVAELLLDRGADVEIRDVDHEGTPIQHHVNSPELLRLLLRAGAKPDIFTAVALDDVDLARQLLAASPETAHAHVGVPPFACEKSEGGHIYAYKLGPRKTPIQVAAERGSRSVLAELLRHADPSERLLAAAWAEDHDAVAAILKDHPQIGAELGENARAIADAAQAGRVGTVRLLIEAGVDPKTPGMDTGSALHTACWFGHLDVVRLLIGHVPLDLLDKSHGSPPLGWATHGAQWCRNPKGDYVGVVEALLAAGADPNAPANREGTTMLAQAGSREDIKETLLRHGAV